MAGLRDPLTQLQNYISLLSVFEHLCVKVRPDEFNARLVRVEPSDGGTFTLTHPSEIGFVNTVILSREAAIPIIEKFVDDWVLTSKMYSDGVLQGGSVETKKTAFNVEFYLKTVRSMGGEYRHLLFPVSAGYAKALEDGEAILPFDTMEYNVLSKVLKGKGFPYGCLKDAVNKHVYTPLVRGHLLRSHNCETHSKSNSDYTKHFCALDMVPQLPTQIRYKMFLTHQMQSAKTVQKNNIIYNFSTKAHHVTMSGTAANRKASSLKPEQIQAALDFAKPSTRCALLYWSPGVGKTVGAWACILDTIRAQENSIWKGTDDVGVTFLSSGLNLPSSKFFEELVQNASMLGVEVRTKEGKPPTLGIQDFRTPIHAYPNNKKIPGVELGWLFEFKISFGSNMQQVSVAVFASTYQRYARCAAMYHVGEAIQNQVKDGFEKPRRCTCVINVCDEAHEMRTTTRESMYEAKHTFASGSTLKNSEKIELLKKLLSKEVITEADMWTCPTTHVKFKSIVWEAMRLRNNYYIKESNNFPTVHKTLILTATPFGNREEHFFNILDCAMYAMNMRMVNNDDYYELDTIGKVRYILKSDFFMASSATVDPLSAPHQDFSCCHVFVGAGGGFVAPGGSDNTPGGVPWFDKDVMNNTILWKAGEEIKCANEMFELQLPVGSALASNDFDDDDNGQVSKVLNIKLFEYDFRSTGIYYFLHNQQVQMVVVDESKDTIEKINQAYWIHMNFLKHRTSARKGADPVKIKIMVRTMSNQSPFAIEKTAEEIYNGLRAFSPKYEMFFYALERLEVDVRSPVMLFFSIVSRAMSEEVGNMSSLLGFIRYSQMRNKNQAEATSKYWFLQFEELKKVKMNFVLAKKEQLDNLVLTEYDIAEELAKIDYNIADILYIYSADWRVRQDGTNDALFECEIRSRLWHLLQKDELVDEDDRQKFINEPNANFVVCSVTGMDQAAKEFATYLCDTMTGMYNHPLNKNGHLIRVLAGSKKIAESNDFRNTRYMFFTKPESDLVDLMQKFGRIARSSDPSRYPYYEYGFDKRHCTRGNDTNLRPIVHYVTLASSDECQSSYNIVKAKMKYYNEYSLMLTKDKTDEGLALLPVRTKGDWIAKCKQLISSYL